MFFIRDNKNKICYGWSAKSGCTHIKNILNYLIHDVNELTHENNFRDSLWLNQIPLIERNGEKYIDTTYKIIIISRNPFERLVSGFKYKKKSMGKTFANITPFSFEYFVNELLNNGVCNSKHPNGNGQINCHHFTPQFSEAWTHVIDELNPPIFKIMDITNIDYPFLENIYNKKIPIQFINYRGEQNVSTNNKLESYKGTNAFKLHINDVLKYDIKSSQLYNADLYEKVKCFYKKDFNTFSKYNLNYDIKF